MGSIQDIESIVSPDGQSLKQAPGSVAELRAHNDQKSSRFFKIDGLGAKKESSLTGMRDELVLLSWCIVLLRTSEEGQASFDWAYSGQSGSLQSHCLNTAQVISSLQRSVEQAGIEILRHISTSAVDHSSPTPTSTSLVLSNSLLSKTNKVDNEVSQ